MKIERYSEAHKNIWDEFVRNSKNGTFLLLRDYMDYHRSRFEDHSLLVWDQGGNLVAVLPANIHGDILYSHGGLTYGGFITDLNMKVPVMLGVFDHILTYMKNKSFNRFVYKTIPYIYHYVPSEEDRYALFLCNANVIRRGALSVIDMRRRLPFQERRLRGIKKAIKKDLLVRISNDFEAFWQLLTAYILGKYNKRPVHSLEEIALLRSRFPENVRLFTCHKNDELLAGVVVYESERVAHVQYVASNDKGKGLGAVDLILSVLIDEVYKAKPFFDLGTSDEDDGRSLKKGLIDQKEGFGARIVVHDHYQIELSGWEPGLLVGVMG